MYDVDFSALRVFLRSGSKTEFSRTRAVAEEKRPELRHAGYIAMPDRRANTFERSASTEGILLLINIIIDAYQKS